MAGTARRFGVLLAGVVACGGTKLQPDGGAEMDASPVVDGGSEADASEGDAASATMQLATGDSLTVAGVTDDGWVVYTDDAAMTLNVVPLAGGASREVAQLSGVSHSATVQHGVAVVLDETPPADGGVALAPTLVIWSASGGTHLLSTSSLGAVVSRDSSRVVYLDHIDAQRHGDLYGARTDGTGATFLTHLSLVSDASVGQAASSSFVVVRDEPGDGGPLLQPLTSYDPQTWAGTDLAPNAYAYAVDATGTRVVFWGAGLQWAPVAGGATMTIDAVGGTPIPTPDGLAVVYWTLGVNPALRRSTLIAPSPQTLAALGGQPTVTALSPDGNWLLYCADSGSGLVEVRLASATTPGTPVVLASKVPADTPLGFTADSSFALYIPDAVADGPGTLTAAPVRGGAPVVLGHAVLGAPWLGGWATSGPGKVVFGANLVPVVYRMAHLYEADLVVASPAQGPASTLIASNVNPRFYLTSAGDHVVYTTVGQSGPLAGLYVAPVP